MPAASELELPFVDTYDPQLRGDHYHDVMRELREASWLARSPRRSEGGERARSCARQLPRRLSAPALGHCAIQVAYTTI